VSCRLRPDGVPQPVGPGSRRVADYPHGAPHGDEQENRTGMKPLGNIPLGAMTLGNTNLGNTAFTDVQP
jgi:hypothetical protein